ncbi:MAG: hypothetical protein WBM12_19235 [Pseudolabrys sp.]
MVEGALEAARKDNSRLQSEVAALRSTLRRGAPLDDAPVPPAEAPNDEAPSKGKRVKGAEGPQAKAGGKAETRRQQDLNRGQVPRFFCSRAHAD